MAAGSVDCGVPSGVKVVWTFIIRGGEPFQIKLKHQIGPVLDHDGLMTIWKMLGTAKEAESVEGMVTGPLIGARVQRYTEVESEEMLAIREERLGRTPSEA
jgi:hypothetical protein